ncbi:MAG: hypothetical protein ACTSRP_24180 [Candidatus Helarchaeota archaeon]
MYRLNKDQQIRRFKNIIEHLKSGEDQYQAMAYQAFNEMLLNNELTREQIETIIPILEEELMDKESNLRTDCFKTVCLLGKLNFEDIKEFFPILIEELSKKNRFRIEIVLDFLCAIGTSDRKEVKEAINSVLENGNMWFNESYLIPIYNDFINKFLSQGNQIIEKYYTQFEKLSKSLSNSKMVSMKENIDKKLEEYKIFIEELRRKKQKEDELRKQKEKIREELRKQKDQVIKKISDQKMVKNEDKKIQKQREISKTDHIENDRIEIYKESVLLNNSIDEYEDSEFISFTKLGLKRANGEEDTDN